MENSYEEALRRFYELLGENVRTVRNERQYTQEELAARVDISRTSITNLENGDQRLPVHNIVRLAGVLGVPLERLVPRWESAQPSERVEVSMDGEKKEISREALEFIQSVRTGSNDA